MVLEHFKHDGGRDKESHSLKFSIEKSHTKAEMNDFK